MRFALVLFIVFIPLCADAFIPVLVQKESGHDVILIEEPTLSQTFYGQLDGSPHTYLIELRNPTLVSLTLSAPLNAEDTYMISSIIVREYPGGGRVEEVARLSAKDAVWSEFFDTRTGDSYRVGNSFERELSPGRYLIQVHTADNIEPYIFAIGTKNENTLSYIELVRRIAGVKVFFNKSQFLVVASPYVYVPLLFIAVIALFAFRFLRGRPVNSLSSS